MKNYVQLIGNCGADAETFTTSTGKQKASVSIATSKGYKDPSGKWVDNTTWHKVVGWNAAASIMVEKCKKGTKALIEGRIDYNNYEDKNGQKRTSTEIVVEKIVVL
jgi:single stranded DNA-binding protein (ssb)